MRHRSPQPNDEKIRQLYEQGVSYLAIAERFGIKWRTVYDAVHAKKFLTAAKQGGNDAGPSTPVT